MVTEQAECVTALSPRCSLMAGFLLGARVPWGFTPAGSTGGPWSSCCPWEEKLRSPLGFGQSESVAVLWLLALLIERLHCKYLHIGCPSVTRGEKKRQQSSCLVLEETLPATCKLPSWSSKALNFCKKALEFIGKL